MAVSWIMTIINEVVADHASSNGMRSRTTNFAPAPAQHPHRALASPAGQANATSSAAAAPAETGHSAGLGAPGAGPTPNHPRGNRVQTRSWGFNGICKSPKGHAQILTQIASRHAVSLIRWRESTWPLGQCAAGDCTALKAPTCHRLFIANDQETTRSARSWRDRQDC